MSVTIVDGTIIEAPVKTRRKGFVRFGQILIERTDGGTERIGAGIAVPEIGDRMIPGARGRFYLFKTLDVKGVHGIRLADGTAIQAYPGKNEVIFIMLLVVNLVWIALIVATKDSVPMLGVLLAILGVVGYLFTRNSRAETRRQFLADAEGPRAPASVAPQTAGD